jgi:(E)-4-hydroxy-3-methylbut-2-enyl-diphosphate synthase
MIEAGCEYIRITAPSIKEAQNLSNIKQKLRKQSYNTPLIADIHFTPNAALVAARIVEKVRINPGNFADRKKFQEIEYTDDSYNYELERIHDRFTPLVKVCKEEGCAMRIGSNHGSLSDRILSRYGDTPIGMVESAMEFIRICEEHNYHDIILSMKASNTRVMVQAYRLLVNRMDAEGMDYPLHLGVTEAGEGEDGRIKSAVGIGSLMEDGLGDTIRVSLTEEPEYEIPVAKSLVKRYKNRSQHSAIQDIVTSPLHPFEYHARESRTVRNLGGDNVPRVIADLSMEEKITADTLQQVGYTYFTAEDKWGIGDFACDYIFIGRKNIDFAIPSTLGIIQTYSIWADNKRADILPLLDVKQYLDNPHIHNKLNFIYATFSDFSSDFLAQLIDDATAILFLDTNNEHGMAEQRRLFMKLITKNCQVPVIISRAYGNLTVENLQLESAIDTGALLIDGLGDGIFIAAENCGTIEMVNQTAFGILQASRTRISKTEYISCPSCGRTLFDLQETTAMVRERTSHLKGVKIGIMGCIVNGPGEMADADYGYVGTGIGKISLYRGQEVVQSNIPLGNAVDNLIGLMKEDGIWVEPDLEAVLV